MISMQKVKVRCPRWRSQRSNFVPIWEFPDRNSTLNQEMAIKWCTKLNVAYKGCPIVSFFKVIRQISRSFRPKTSMFFTRIERFRTVTHFEFTDGFEMMHKIWSGIEQVPYCFSRSSIKFQGHTGRQSTICLQLQFTDGYKIAHIASRSAGVVFYCIFRSAVKYQVQTDWNNDDLSKIIRPVAAIRSLRFALFRNLSILRQLFRVLRSNTRVSLHFQTSACLCSIR